MRYSLQRFSRFRFKPFSLGAEREIVGVPYSFGSVKLMLDFRPSLALPARARVRSYAALAETALQGL